MILRVIFLFGLECHYSIKFFRKIFNFLKICRYKNLSNNTVSYTEMGVAGIIPTFNLYFFKKIVIFGFFLKSYLFYFSYFIRKSYFYPDIPKNYQISNLKSIFNFGLIIIYNNFILNSYYKFIKINKIHIEEDASKTFYNLKDNFLIIDFNRSNNFLLELVSYYNLNSFYEIILFLKNLNYFLFFLKKKIIKNFFRFDLNISIKYLFYNYTIFKIEIKNINSFFILKNIIDFEIKRQIYNLIFIKFYKNETRFYNLIKKFTYFVRNKENFFNYRYFNEIDKNYLYLCLNFKKNFKLKVLLFFYIKIYYFYNFELILKYNFILIEIILFIFKFKSSKVIFLFKNKIINYFIFKKKYNLASIFSLIILLKCYLNKILNLFNFKKILFLIFLKISKNNLFVYNTIIKNNILLIKKNIEKFLNYIILIYIKFIHIFIFNKKIFNFFIGIIIKLNINFKNFFNSLNIKIIV
ncbi:aspartyl/glutamyl-tRNA amidotransferasesubunit B [Candidatus Nasuia deltocephalinicola]|uniref:Aspartyl/glutamyl-tRNA amidotransferasesubunit B n=1 Tax=Candidatus Nasuia deltocephalincola TaxID=1160784 RepID=A0A7G6UHU5_9PROT|nr:aspartyl/glutamyl-tRNA amidotransferasesubunit B [Candidatus Nasuia deltocephalinicola]